MTKKMFGGNSGFQNVFYPKVKGEYRMDVVSCPYCKRFSQLCCSELTKIFCANDDRVYGNLPGLEFRRAVTPIIVSRNSVGSSPLPNRSIMATSRDSMATSAVVMLMTFRDHTQTMRSIHVVVALMSELVSHCGRTVGCHHHRDCQKSVSNGLKNSPNWYIVSAS